MLSLAHYRTRLGDRLLSSLVAPANARLGFAIKARPAIVDELTVVMERHLRSIRDQREAYDIEKESTAIGRRIRRCFVGG
jgi:hypothetical protein